MLAEVVVAGEKSSLGSSPAPVHVRTIRVGILGLGQVGQAVARLAPAAARLRESGLRFRILNALVRDVERPRRCPRPPRVTSNPAAFLRGTYDVVIEALPTIDPARTIVARLLGRGIPVVSANKALVAAHGHELSALANRRGTTLRYEASALAGVPFLGALAERPLFSDVNRFTAVVNGTSNFILSTLERERGSFAAALERAGRLGLTEPDPSRDLDGADAAAKFALLASLFGWGLSDQVPRADGREPTAAGHSHDGNRSAGLEVEGIRHVSADDLGVARQLDATIKPLVFASRTDSGVEAFIGPALVPARHPLASLAGTLSGIQFSGRFVSDLFFSGPGAGPDVTAATILDDAVEAVSTMRKIPRRPRRTPAALPLVAPATEWFVRARFPGVVPEASTVPAAFCAAGLSVAQVTDAIGATRWLRVGEAPRDHVMRACTNLRHTHRIDCHAIRSI